jgi:mono/diheme cytochrome c family protein
MGLAQGPDGSLYMNDSEKGKIWRVMFKGDKNNFGTKQLAVMAARKLTSPNVKTPDIEKDNLMRGQLAAGSKLYNTYCASCHQQNGKGDGTRFPPLAESEWVNGDKKKLIEVVLNGLSGPITVKGVGYNEAMPPHGYLQDSEIAQILTYVRSSFGNNSGFVSPNEVSRYRAKK